MICFSWLDELTFCEIFNGTHVDKIDFEFEAYHWQGELTLYNGRPTAIGGFRAKGAVETLTEEEGWINLKKHPK